MADSGSSGSGTTVSGGGSSTYSSSSSGIVGPILSLIGGGISMSRGERATKEARGWSEYMSSSAYQRSVQDMRAAGLNPAMMYAGGGSGASTPSTSAAQVSDLSSLGSTAISSIKLREELELLKRSQDKLSADTDLSERQSDKARSETKLNEYMMDKVKEDTANTRINSALTAEQIPEAKANAEFWRNESGEGVKAIQRILQILGIGKSGR